MLFIAGLKVAAQILSRESKKKTVDKRLHTRKNIIICIETVIIA